MTKNQEVIECIVKRVIQNQDSRVCDIRIRHTARYSTETWSLDVPPELMIFPGDTVKITVEWPLNPEDV